MKLLMDKNVNLSDTEQVSCRCCGQTKKCEVEWTMESLRKLLTDYITIQECAQCRVANAKGREYTQDSEQINYKRDDLCNTQRFSAESSKGDRRTFQETPVDTLTTRRR